jgi:LysM repeat protein
MKKHKLSSLRALMPQPKVRKQNSQLNKLTAHAGRLAPPAYDDYEEEPTTKLSTAFVVVLVLHLVAVGGIYAFHSIKAKRRDADGTAAIAKSTAPQTNPQTATAKLPVPAPLPAAPAPAGSPAAATGVAQPVTAKAGTPAAHHEKTIPQLPAPNGGPSAVLPQNKAGAGTAPVQAQATLKAISTGAASVKAPVSVASAQPVVAQGVDSLAKTYTVVKGDNPVAIAKRMNVNYEEMLKLNAIDDPKKLKIGQVLKLPAKKQSN